MSRSPGATALVAALRVRTAPRRACPSRAGTLLTVLASSLVMCASAHAAVGSTQVGSSVDTNAPGRAQDYRVSANASGRIDRLSVFLDRSSTAKVVGIGLYASSGSATAGALLARCGVYKTVPGAWNRCSIPAVTVTAGQTYWLSILQPTGTSGTIAFRNDPASGRTFGSYSSTLSTLADTNPWRNGPDWGAQTASVYGDQASAEPAPSPSPTPTPTPSPSATPTPSPSATPTPTPTPSPSATPTPTPTPSPSPAGTCAVSTPNVADGRDPWGGCWPGPSNTGVPAGTVLTDYTGPCTITAANTVIDSKNVDCYLEIHAPGVVIRNSYITGHVWIDDPSTNASFTISDSTIDAGPVDTGGAYNDGNSAIGKSHFTATRVETFRGIRGIWCEFDCTVRDSWVHGQDKDEGGAAHESGIRMGSDSDPAHGQLIQHNSIRCDPPDVPPDGGCSADLTGYGDFAPIQNNTIDRNLFLATTGGACAYGGSSGANGVKPYGADANHDVFTNNVFQHRSEFQASGNCGYWFAIEDFDASRPGNQWVNNTWDTGGAVSP